MRAARTSRSSRVRSTLAAAGVVLGSVVAGATGAPRAAEAAGIDDVTITIDSPVEGTTLDGAVEVTYTVTAPVGTTVGRADAQFAGRAQGVDLTGRDCSTGCTSTARFDTAAAPLPVSGDQARWTNDGPQWFSAEVEVNGIWKSTSVDVVLDNHRPTVSIEGMGVDDGRAAFPLTARDSLTIAARATAHDGGQITGVTLVDGLTERPMTPPATPGGAWTYTWDTTAIRNTSVTAFVRARDDRGVANMGARVAFVVDHGFNLTPPTLTDPVVDDDLGTVRLGYAYGPPGTFLVDTHPVRVVTYLDGVQTSDRDDYGLETLQHPGWITAYPEARVPAGRHTLSFVVTDNRGATGRLDLPVNVTSTLFGRFDTGADATVLPGAPLPVSATIWSTRDTLWFWQLSVDGAGLTSGGPQNDCTLDCPTTLTPTGTVSSTVPGSHTLELLVVPLHGSPQTYATTFRVLPYATARVSPPAGPATFGHPLGLRGTATLTGGEPAGGARVTLERRLTGSTGWAPVGTVTADPAGTVAFTVTAARTAHYRMRTATLDAHWGGTPGPLVTVRSQASITMVKAPTASRRGRAVSVEARVLPVERGYQPVLLQRYVDGQWRRVAPPAYPTTTGRTTWTYTASATGRQRLRVLRPASTGIVSTPGRTWTLSVTR